MTATTGVEPPPATPPPETLVILCLGGDELCAALGDGGPLADAIGRRTARVPAVEVRHGPTGPLADLATPAWEPLLSGAHVVLRSISPDVLDAPEVASGAGEADGGLGTGALADRFRPLMTDLIGRVKAAGATFVAVNGATFDPADRVHSYRDPGCTAAIAIHRLDLELIRLSMSEGISVLDTDRLQSQVGADGVEAALRYRRPLLDVMVDEIALVLDEYGWLDDRPVLPQEGRRAANTEAVG